MHPQKLLHLYKWYIFKFTVLSPYAINDNKSPDIYVYAVEYNEVPLRIKITIHTVRKS